MGCALEQLETLRAGEIDLGLARVEHVARLLDLPLTGRRRPLYALVGGTNGKGTAAWALAGLLAELGATVVRFTSPHLVDPRERVAAPPTFGRIPAEVAEELARDVLAAARRAGEPLTWFEGWALLALLWARALRADAAVLEVGLGGRFDAVNVVEADVSVITRVAIDHVEHLGPTREAIAREKGAIARTGRPLVTGIEPALLSAALGDIRPRPLDVLGVDFDVVRGNDGWTLTSAASESARIGPLDTPAWMAADQALAVRAARWIDTGTGRLELSDVLCAHRPPCRYQRFERSGVAFVADGAHNPDAARALASTLGETPPVAAIVALRRNKDARGFLEALAPSVAQWWFPRLGGDANRWWPPERLTAYAATRPTHAGSTLDEALEAATGWARRHGARVLLTGSLYFLGSLVERGVVPPCPTPRATPPPR